MNENKTSAAEIKQFGSPVTLRMILFVIAGAAAIVCMFMNWFPVELDLGMVQFEEAFGKVNVFTLSKTLSEVEEALGMFASYLPEEYGAYKLWSAILMICAVVAIASYVCGAVLKVLKKTKVADLISGVASVCTIITSVGFCTLISSFYKEFGGIAASRNALSVVLNSPWQVVLLCGVVSGVCTLPQGTVGNTISVCVEWCVVVVQKVVSYIAEVFGVIIGNIGYIASDILGGAVGIFVGKWIASITGTNILGVVSGLVVAALTAIVCCTVVCLLSGRSDELKVVFRTK